MKRKYRITSTEKRNEITESLKQRMMVLNNRLKRYIERQKQYQDNYLFENSPEKFYEQLRGTNINIDNAPTKEELDAYWRSKFEQKK